MPLPMLADFALRLTAGLAFFLLLTPWRVVPPAFFRTHCLIMLALLVVAALDPGRQGGGRAALWAMIAAAALAYIASIGWGLGLKVVGAPATVLVLLAAAGLLVAASLSPDAGRSGAAVATRLTSAALLGSTLTAMLLGHHYLTAPAMSISPLLRFVGAMILGVAARAATAGLGTAWWLSGHGPPLESQGSFYPLLLAMRWGMGIAGVGLAAWLAWQTAKIRSTQSATGILYIGMVLALLGELTGLILARDVGIPA